MGRKPEPLRRIPSFFKVMIGDFSEHLKIPPTFVKHFDDVLPQKIVLGSNAMRVTCVHVKKVGNNLFFGEGWGLFVKDNSLEFGDFLVFRYLGNSEFNVTIYGKNGCEKEASVVTRKSNDVIYIDSDCTGDETSMSRLQDESKCEEFQPHQGKERAGSRVRLVTQKPSCSRVSVAMHGKARALEAANKFVSKHPFFKIVIRRSYQRKGYLYLPASFFKRYIKEARQSVMLRVSNRSWPVGIYVYSMNIIRICAGCPAFVKDNTLVDGDVCVFELIKVNDIEFKVSIFRCSG